MSLLKMVTGMMSDGMIGKVASLIGSNAGVTKSALTSVMPSILRGIASKGSTASGASSLINLIKNHGLSSGSMDMGADLMDKGGKMNDAIFGSSLKDISVPGLKGDSRSKLLNMATPMAMGSLGKVVKEKNLDANGLSAYLKDNVGSTAAKATATRTAGTTKATTSGGGGFMRWLLPLLAILGIGWWFMNSQGAEVTTNTEEATETSTTVQGDAHSGTHTHADGTVHHGHSHSSTTDAANAAGQAGKDAMNKAAELGKNAGGAVSGAAGAVAGAAGDMKTVVKGLSLDADGNLIKDGEMFLKKGEFSVKDGEYFDKDGKSLGFLAKIGKAIGDAGKAVGGAVAGAAGKTADFFKDSFGGMFNKKKGGEAVAAYSLSQIKFDEESHKITSFSKNEVQGLAAALKANPDANITVQATGGDKKLSGKKAQVIHDMLVTLGVKDSQIKAKGMGDGAEKFEILID